MFYMHFFNIFPIHKYCQTVYKKSQKKVRSIGVFYSD